MKFDRPFARWPFVILETIAAALIITFRALALVLCTISRIYHTLLLVLAHFIIFLFVWWNNIRSVATRWYKQIQYDKARRRYNGMHPEPELDGGTKMIHTVTGAVSAVVGLHNYSVHKDICMTNRQCMNYFWEFHANIVLGNAAMAVCWYLFDEPVTWSDSPLLIVVAAGTLVGSLYDVVVMSIFCHEYVRDIPDHFSQEVPLDYMDMHQYL